MASLTLKNIPAPLLERLRERAGAERRSLTQEALHLLEEALDRPAGGPGPEMQTASAERIEAELQANSWSALAGGWQSDLEPREEIDRILAARTVGRDVDL